MSILVNDVIINKIAGATDNIVKIVTIFNAGTTDSTPSTSLKLISSDGIDMFANNAVHGTTKAEHSIKKKFVNFKVLVAILASP